MTQPRLSAAGGFAAIRHVISQVRESGQPKELYDRLRSANTCKPCALGMGGELGGMVNEAGHFPEVCKKSVQAEAADLQRAIPETFFESTDIDALLAMTSREAENLGRLAFPIAIAPGERRFRRMTWQESADLIGSALAAARPDRTFFYASGRSSNEAAFLTQLVARAYGTANVHNCSFYCHNASAVALSRVCGTGTSSVELADLALTDLAVVAGANPASNHPRLIAQLVRLRRRGGKVIVINPLSELGLRRFRMPSDVRSLISGSVVSDLYLQPRVGGDVHLLMGLLKRVRELGAVDHAYVAARTRGWADLERRLDDLSWDDLVAGSGVDRAQIDEAASVIGAAPSGIFMWAVGLTHHAHGTDNILALANLALARGFLGRPGSGLLPIRGHSNVQGIGSMGVSPALRGDFADRLGTRYGIDVGSAGGQDTYASMEAASDGLIDVAVLLGGNLWASNPDSAWAADAMRRIGLTYSMTTKLNPGHFHGRGETAVIVPVLARNEEEQPTTQESMFNYVRFSAGGSAGLVGEQRSEVAVIASIAERVLPPGRFDWSALRSHDELRKAIAATVGGYEEIARRPAEPAADARRRRRARSAGPTREFAVAGRIMHGGPFPTEDGRAGFNLVELPGLPGDPDVLMLATLRSEGQFNSVVYDEADIYRGNSCRDVVMISEADAQARHLGEGDRVCVTSAVGSMAVTVAIVDISRGSAAMYYPEANVLVPRTLDPRSRTPAFKSVPVTLRRV